MTMAGIIGGQWRPQQMRQQLWPWSAWQLWRQQSFQQWDVATAKQLQW